MESWLLLTTYKNNFDFMETYVNFYSSVWGIKDFYFLIGITPKTDFSVIEDRITKISIDLSVTINYLSFETEDYVTEREWGIQKEKYFTEINSKIAKNFTKILNIDNDEFYFIKNKDVIKNKNQLHFHFLEYIPRENFNINDNFKWSLQGWFYRVNSFKDKSYSEVSEEIRENEYKKLLTDLVSPSSIKGDKITHQWCKIVRFNRKDFILDPWEHAGGGKICAEIKSARTLEGVIDILQNNYFCFHLGVLDKKYFLNSKPKWINRITRKIKHQAGDFKNLSSEEYFEKYYSKTNAPVIVNNLLKEYWIN